MITLLIFLMLNLPWNVNKCRILLVYVSVHDFTFWKENFPQHISTAFTLGRLLTKNNQKTLFTLKVLNQCQQFRENFIGVLDRLPGITLRASKVGLPMCVEALSHVQVE